MQTKITERESCIKMYKYLKDIKIKNEKELIILEGFQFISATGSRKVI